MPRSVDEVVGAQGASQVIANWMVAKSYSSDVISLRLVGDGDDHSDERTPRSRWNPVPEGSMRSQR
jgi:hypothetical protein